MYIEFHLPTGAAGMAAGMTAYNVRQKLKLWAEEHNVVYHVHHWGYKLHVTFDNKTDYTLFSLSFTANIPHGWKIIDESLPKKLTVKNIKV